MRKNIVIKIIVTVTLLFQGGFSNADDSIDYNPTDNGFNGSTTGTGNIPAETVPDDAFTEFRQIQIREAEIINKSYNTYISDEYLTKVWNKIWQLAEFNKLDETSKWLMTFTWFNLKSTNRIRRLSNDLRINANIPKISCSTPETCSKQNAVYMPLSNLIFVDYGSLDNEDIIKFYHELVHAVQYNIRFPMDFLTLYKESKKSGDSAISESRIIDLLRFLYEAQANWYSIRLGHDKRWSSVLRNFYVFPFYYFKSLFAMLSVTGTVRLGISSFDKWLPQIDQKGSGYIQDWSQASVDDFREPLILYMPLHLLNIGVNIDMGTHESFIKSVERYYYGKVDFIHLKNGADQLAFKAMNDNYYPRMDRSFPTDCVTVLRSIVRSNSPIIAWLTLPEENFTKCKPFYDEDFFKHRDELIRVITDPTKWSFYHRGTEGGHGPSIDIDPHGTEGGHGPSLEIHPQLEIKP